MVGGQCDQIRRFLEALNNKSAYKSSQKRMPTFWGYFEKSLVLLVQTDVGTIWATLATFGLLFYSNIWTHWL